MAVPARRSVKAMGTPSAMNPIRQPRKISTVILNSLIPVIARILVRASLYLVKRTLRRHQIPFSLA